MSDKKTVDTTELPPVATENTESIETKKVDSKPLPPTPSNPLLERAQMPGEDHRLPSGGVFYNDGELDSSVENGEVHIHPLTTMDEINISSPALLYSGEGIVKAIKRCVPSVLKPEMLLAQDVDFILLCMRKISYGPKFEFTRTHYECGGLEDDQEPTEQTYEANLDKVISVTKSLNVTKMAKIYTLELDSGQIVKFEPLRFGVYVNLMQAQAHAAREDVDEEQQKNLILDQLAGVIAAVDEISDTKMIREWLEIVTSAQIRSINDKIEEVANWGVNTTVKVKCRTCKETMEVELPTSPLVLFS